MITPKIASGMVVHLNGLSSVQFRDSPINFRVISEPKPSGQSDEWAWLSGYELDDHRDAVRRRDVYVYLAGVRKARNN